MISREGEQVSRQITPTHGAHEAFSAAAGLPIGVCGVCGSVGATKSRNGRRCRRRCRCLLLLVVVLLLLVMLSSPVRPLRARKSSACAANRSVRRQRFAGASTMDASQLAMPPWHFAVVA